MPSILITGASRGVGLEIAKKFAQNNWNVAILAKTVKPHEKLPGTIWTAAEEIAACGNGKVLPIPCDVRDLLDLRAAVEQAGREFNAIDMLINNASSVYLHNLHDLNEKEYDLMHDIIVRGALFASKYAMPYLDKSLNPRIVNIAPKVNMQNIWFKDHTAYTMCKFASSMMVQGLAAELSNVVVLGLWPAKLLNTTAVKYLLGQSALCRTRNPSIMADSAFCMTDYGLEMSGKCYLDEEVIAMHGLDLSKYSKSDIDLLPDLYV